MNIDTENNLERGRQEIWRRKKLFIASLFLLIPYFVLIVLPAGHFFNVWLAALYLVSVLFCIYQINKKVINSLCPNCGKEIFALTAKTALSAKQCHHCRIDLSPVGKSDGLVSFSPIIYKAGTTDKLN